MLLLAYMFHKHMLVNLQRSCVQDEPIELTVYADKQPVLTKSYIDFVKDLDQLDLL